MKAAVECRLCPRRCRLEHGQRGDCRVRMNIDGELKTLVYGNPCAVHVDPIEKKPLFHVLPGTGAFSLATAGCNLHCKFCQNWQISQRPPEETRNTTLPPEAVVSEALRTGCRSVAYTYSDPVIFYEYMTDTSRLAKEHRLLNLMITAGYIEKEPLIDLCPLIHAANVDLKGITEDYYRRMCDGTLATVLDAIRVMHDRGVWVELTNLLVPTWNDRPEDIRPLCRWIRDHLGPDVPLHFSRFWPMFQLKNLPPTPRRTLDLAYTIGREEGLHYVYVGNFPGHPGNNTHCPKDGRLLIRRYGLAILENHLKDGACPSCGTPVPGIWRIE